MFPLFKMTNDWRHFSTLLVIYTHFVDGNGDNLHNALHHLGIKLPFVSITHEHKVVCVCLTFTISLNRPGK